MQKISGKLNFIYVFGNKKKQKNLGDEIFSRKQT